MSVGVALNPRPEGFEPNTARAMGDPVWLALTVSSDLDLAATTAG